MLRRRLSLAVTVGVISALSTLTLAAPSEASRGGQAVKMHDDCHPKTFNAAIAPDACVGDGDTKFNAFIAELEATQIAEDWEFDPSMLTIHKGRPVILKNEGGETHTWTLVEEFGGGFVPLLNDLSGNFKPAEECFQPPGNNPAAKTPQINVFVEAGKEKALQTAGLKPGKYKFECCIHPWMRVILTVK